MSHAKTEEVVHITKNHPGAEHDHVKHTANELAKLHAEEAASAAVHQHRPDGSIVPKVVFSFVFPHLDHSAPPHIVPLHNKGHITHELLQTFSKPNDRVKGGFFVTVEQKSWSNETTVDEPWMIESYFKALLPILKKKSTSGVAYPFWPASKSAKESEATEAKVLMHLVPQHETALELEHEDHHCCVKVMTKRIRVPVKEFVDSLCTEAEFLLKLLSQLNAAVVGEDTMKKFPNQERLTAFVEECRSLLAN